VVIQISKFSTGKNMAIEVINKNHLSATKTVICKNCGAELRYTNADTRNETRTDYTGGKDTYKYIDCPECRHSINVGFA
jgi:DNA-directed RNA polymerase subunit RPC12/RpoP